MSHPRGNSWIYVYVNLLWLLVFLNISCTWSGCQMSTVEHSHHLFWLFVWEPGKTYCTKICGKIFHSQSVIFLPQKKKASWKKSFSFAMLLLYLQNLLNFASKIFTSFFQRGTKSWNLLWKYLTKKCQQKKWKREFFQINIWWALFSLYFIFSYVVFSVLLLVASSARDAFLFCMKALQSFPF